MRPTDPRELLHPVLPPETYQRLGIAPPRPPQLYGTGGPVSSAGTPYLTGRAVTGAPSSQDALAPSGQDGPGAVATASPAGPSYVPGSPPYVPGAPAGPPPAKDRSVAIVLGATVLIIAIIYGLSTDYEVFLMSRMVEARTAGATTEEAVLVGAQRTGRIVTAAALIRTRYERSKGRFDFPALAPSAPLAKGRDGKPDRQADEQREGDDPGSGDRTDQGGPGRLPDTCPHGLGIGQGDHPVDGDPRPDVGPVEGLQQRLRQGQPCQRPLQGHPLAPACRP